MQINKVSDSFRPRAIGLTKPTEAILFNIEQCASVNETAPNFVGCSPLGVTGSAVLSFQPGTLTTFSTKTTSNSMSGMSGTDTGGSLVSIVTGKTESALTTFSGSVPVTAIFNGAALLTGSCSVPYFAQVTDSMGVITEYPEIGCTHNQEGCCPFDSHENAVLSKCPSDYFTTSGACCPSGWQIYFTAIGAKTPCYTMPSITHVPAISPTVSGVTVITEHVFTRKFELASDVGNSSKKGFPVGAAAGIAIGVVLLASILTVFFILRHKKQQKISQEQEAASRLSHPLGAELTSGEKTPPYKPSVAELASPQGMTRSPESPSKTWTSAGSPPAYNQPSEPVRSSKPLPPQELPGSTFMYEHHPAFASAPTETESTLPASTTPPRSPPQRSTMTASPIISPMSSPSQK